MAEANQLAFNGFSYLDSWLGRLDEQTGRKSPVLAYCDITGCTDQRSCIRCACHKSVPVYFGEHLKILQHSVEDSVNFFV